MRQRSLTPPKPAAEALKEQLDRVKAPYIEIGKKLFLIQQDTFTKQLLLDKTLRQCIEYVQKQKKDKEPIAIKNLGLAGDQVKDLTSLKALGAAVKTLQKKFGNKPIPPQVFKTLLANEFKKEYAALKQEKQKNDKEQKNKNEPRPEEDVAVKPLQLEANANVDGGAPEATAMQNQKMNKGGGQIKLDSRNIPTAGVAPSGTKSSTLANVARRHDSNTPSSTDAAKPTPAPTNAAKPETKTLTSSWIRQPIKQQEQRENAAVKPPPPPPTPFSTVPKKPNQTY